jgi:hypothetical protein
VVRVPTTAEALTLIEAYRRRTVVLRARFVREFVALWPGPEALLDPALRAAWMGLVIELVRQWRPVFHQLALEHYRQQATLDTGAVPAVLVAGTVPVAELEAGQVVGAMLVTAIGPLFRTQRRIDLLARSEPRQALFRRAEPRALAAAAESAARVALNAGRQAVENTIAQDRLARGWMRVTDGDPCAFCAMLASRGAVYKSAQSAGFELDPVRGEINRYHDNCGCQVVPVFTRTPVLPGTTQRAEQLWRDSQRAARAAGELDRGTSNDPLNALRRHMAGAGNG